MASEGGARGRVSTCSAGFNWIVGGIMVATLVALREAGSLLALASTPDGRSYSTRVFSGPTLPGNPDLADALALWTDVDGDASLAEAATRVLQFHVLLDFVFMAAYGFVLWRVLTALRVNRSFSLAAPLATVAADAIETTLFGIAVATRSASAVLLGAVQLAGLVKWVALAVAVVAIAVAWWRDDDETKAGPIAGRATVAESVGRAIRRGSLPTPIAVVGQLVIIGAFGVLVAVPGGSALAQVPDVMRAQLDPIEPSTLFTADALPAALAIGALLLFALAAMTSAAIGGVRPRTVPEPIGSALPLVLTFLFGGAMAAAGVWIDGGPSVPPWSAFAVALLLWIGSRIARRAAPDPSTAVGGPTVMIRPRPSSNDAPQLFGDDDRLNRWVSALAALVVVIGGIGLIRASAPLVMLGEGGARWIVAMASGFVTVCLVGTFVQWALTEPVFGRLMAGPMRKVIAAVVILAVLAAAGTLAYRPELASNLGTNGTMAIGFAFYILLVGFLQRLSRLGRPWRATQELGFGQRTPWALLLVGTWAVASFVNTTPGYHALPVLDEAATVPADEYRHPSVVAAFDSWYERNTVSACGPTADDDEDPTTVPIVFVAAPGGGIRAAYWTGTMLEELFPGECRDRVFLASGASGGAVGISVWASNLADAPATGLEAGPDGVGPTREALTGLSRDQALAATVATLLLRDVAQPITGLRTAWGDRAEALERGWIDSAAPRGDAGPQPFGTLDDPRPFSDLGQPGPGEAWQPLVALNASSVRDGCRVPASTVAGLPASDAAACLQPPGRVGGPSRASIDPFPAVNAEGCAAADEVGYAVQSIALNAARFPYVTPSGSTRYCPAGASTPRDLFQVDGGYFENSGLLTVLEVWRAIEPLVRDRNDAEGATVRIEPWILLLANDYRSEGQVGPPARPLELFVPLSTVLNNQVTSPAALVQQSAEAMLGFRDPMGEGSTREAPVAVGDAPACSDGYARLGPTARIEVSAPLGWVLSATSQESLDTFRDEVLGRGEAAGDPDRCIAGLIRLLDDRGGEG